MSTKSMNRSTANRSAALAALGAWALALAGCSGADGGTSRIPPPDPDYPPGPGTGAAVPVTTASSIVAYFTSVTLPSDGRTVVKLYLHDVDDRPLIGLRASNISFVLSRLEPASNGKSSTWHAITRRQESCPGTPTPNPDTNPPLTCTPGTSVNQGYIEPATAGAWVDNGDGTYQYTFQQSVLNIPDIPYDPNLTHRVGLEIRLNPAGGASPASIPANNALIDWVPALNLPTAVTASGRTIVTNADCNACHQNLAVHGAARFDVNYCTMCHESYSYDAQTGNSLDFRVMIHKVHAGRDLPSVVAGAPYGIYGFGNRFVDFSDVAFPQDLRNCQTCHHGDNPEAPQGDAWRTTVNVTVCSTCHDNVNFTTGENHGNGGAATDEQCYTCHGPNAGFAELQAPGAHAVPTRIAAGDFLFQIVKIAAIKQDGSPGDAPCDAASVACTVLPGEYPLVTIKVVNPRTGSTWAFSDAPFTNTIGTTAPRVRARVAYTTRNLTNPGTGNNPSLPIQIDYLSSAAAPVGAPAAAGGAPVRNADGSYTKAGATAIPAGLLGGSGVAYVEGRTIVDVDPSPAATQLAVVGVDASAGVSYAITDPTPVAPRQVVSIERCDACHSRLLFHGDNRNNSTGLCATCHNPNFASGSTPATGQPWDFKLLIHALHASTYSYGGETLEPVLYPGYLQNCEGCHEPGTYYPVDPTVVFATSIDVGADAASPADDTAITPNTAVCSTCHVDDAARQHMVFNGGSYTATKNADGTSPQAAAENCGACHGAGRSVDVKVAHRIDEFRYNQ